MAKLINKTQGYTVVSNVIVKDIRLSLKDRGLLVTILSLPDNWEFSIAGLASIVNDGKDSIRSSVKRLEGLGYLKRIQVRSDSGQFEGCDWLICEECFSNNSPKDGIPSSENQPSGKPMAEKAMQYSKQESIKKEFNKKDECGAHADVKLVNPYWKVSNDELNQLQKEYPDYADEVISRAKTYPRKLFNYTVLRSWCEERRERQKIGRSKPLIEHGFQQRSYNYDDLEGQLLSKNGIIA